MVSGNTYSERLDAIILPEILPRILLAQRQTFQIAFVLGYNHVTVPWGHSS